MDSLWGDAIRRAIKRREDADPQALERLAEKLLTMADGDGSQALGALRELGDRLDGKAPQSLDVTTTHERSTSEWTLAEIDAELARRGVTPSKAPAVNGQGKPH